MRKLIIIISAISIVVALILCIVLLSPKPSPLHPKSDINFSFEHACEIFNSGPNADNQFIDYTLFISTHSGTPFENPEISASNNVSFLAKTDISPISVTFQILHGTSFTFSITSTNFETFSKTYSATEFVQAENISLMISTSPDDEFMPYVAGTNNIVYFVDPAKQALANAAGFATKLYIKANLDANFSFSLAENSCFEETPSTIFGIKPLRTGTSYVTAHANDGSGASKKFAFTAKHIAPTGVSGLPESINFDMAESPTFTLNSISVVPTFAENSELSLSSSNQEIFTISGKVITAVSPGTANLIVKLSGADIKLIPVTITQTLEPEFVFTLNGATTEFYGSAVTFFSSDNTIQFNATALNHSYYTLTINISLSHFSGSIGTITPYITDSSSIIIQDTGAAPEFGFGSPDFVTYQLNILHKTGSFSIKFSKIHNSKEISAILNFVIT